FSSGTNKMLKGSINLNFIRFFNSASEFLDFSIEMLQSTEDATTSAVPSILVISGDKGIFEVTNTEVESYNSQAPQISGGVTTYSANMGTAGTILTVIPTVREDDSILLNIKIEDSEYTKSGRALDPTMGDVNPKITRKIESNVIIQNGETIFIGGMKKARSTFTNSQVPILGSIPFIGALFRSQGTTKEITDLYMKLKVEIATSSNVKKDFSTEGLKFKEIHDYNNSERVNKNIYPHFKIKPNTPE
ncbi:MAG: type II secretion system protein GspD, partial [Fusobacteriaceae bacterium]